MSSHKLYFVDSYLKNGQRYEDIERIFACSHSRELISMDKIIYNIHGHSFLCMSSGDSSSSLILIHLSFSIIISL